ncbi:tetratricopeptide repeat protein, partial [Leptospira sp. SA-E8]|uniref:tetratricopeptide repeat protein n=1 Tax=Leptospira sp. SA-E8 TaxID=3422259 RepID=UPI003EB89F25
GDYDRFFSDMDLAAGRVKSSFQNAATFYLSGLIYEATGQFNDAYIDYRKALEIAPDNSYLQKDVVRTGLRSGMDDAKKLAQQLKLPIAPPASKQAQTQDPAQNPAQGELVIYLEEGLVPAKQPVSIPIFTNRTSN